GSPLFGEEIDGETPLAPSDDQWSGPAGVAEGLWHPTGLHTGPTHLVTDRLSLSTLSTPLAWKRHYHT
ncbi:hypothetical protein KUCAC02_017590, partial [Chaenocephalus aceratus]